MDFRKEKKNHRRILSLLIVCVASTTNVAETCLQKNILFPAVFYYYTRSGSSMTSRAGNRFVQFDTSGTRVVNIALRIIVSNNISGKILINKKVREIRKKNNTSNSEKLRLR